MKAFRVKDLMINVIPQRSGGGGSSMPGPDDDIDDFSPWTPIIIIPKYYAVIAKLVAKSAKFNKEVLDVAALEVGREIVGRMAVSYCSEDMPTCRDLTPWVSRVAAGGGGGAAICTEESPTCRNDARLSLVASVPSLDFEDLVIVKEQLSELVADITRLENRRLDLARKEASKLVPKLESAIDELKKAAK